MRRDVDEELFLYRVVSGRQLRFKCRSRYSGSILPYAKERDAGISAMYQLNT